MFVNSLDDLAIGCIEITPWNFFLGKNFNIKERTFQLKQHLEALTQVK